MPTALFPALALHHFHGGLGLAGVLYAAPGFGALVASGMSGWTPRVRRPGRAVVIAITIWGLGLAGFGLVSYLPLAVLLLAIAGGADVISAVFRSTIIQTQTPDRLRGRLSSLQQAVVTSGPRLGNGEAGIVAALTNTQFSVISGGLGCVIGIAIIAKAMPNFVNYEISSARVVLDEEDPVPDVRRSSASSFCRIGSANPSGSPCRSRGSRLRARERNGLALREVAGGEGCRHRQFRGDD